MMNKLFHIGQHVVTKITSIAVDGTYYQVTLSLIPDDIHSELTHSVVKEGMVIYLNWLPDWYLIINY